MPEPACGKKTRHSFAPFCAKLLRLENRDYAQAIRREFGNWAKAIEAAGSQPDQ
jgi:hypothetical protein